MLKIDSKGLFHRFKGLFTRFLTPFERKSTFEAKSSAALRGTKRACTLYLDTSTALVLRLLSDHRKITMSQLVEQLVNKEWDEDRGKALNATSVTRFHKKPARSCGESYGKPVLGKKSCPQPGGTGSFSSKPLDTAPQMGAKTIRPIVIDIEGYKKRRNESLQALA